VTALPLLLLYILVRLFHFSVLGLDMGSRDLRVRSFAPFTN